MNLTGKTVVVYGAGISGISAAQLVRDHGGRAVIYDDNPTKSHSTSCTSVFNDCDIVVVSPGVPSGNEHVLDARLGGKQVLSELEFASLFCRAEQIAVTGTNGKTTTTLLIDHILKYARIPSHAVGNVGAAFSSIADKLDAMEVAVIEASSFQLEGARYFAPDIAVMLNITPDHLDRHVQRRRRKRALPRTRDQSAQSSFQHFASRGRGVSLVGIRVLPRNARGRGVRSGFRRERA